MPPVSLWGEKTVQLNWLSDGCSDRNRITEEIFVCCRRRERRPWQTSSWQSWLMFAGTNALLGASEAASAGVRLRACPTAPNASQKWRWWPCNASPSASWSHIGVSLQLKFLYPLDQTEYMCCAVARVLLYFCWRTIVGEIDRKAGPMCNVLLVLLYVLTRSEAEAKKCSYMRSKVTWCWIKMIMSWCATRPTNLPPYPGYVD